MLEVNFHSVDFGLIMHRSTALLLKLARADVTFDAQNILFPLIVLLFNVCVHWLSG